MLGACFIVNYVTADAKTNWVEGFAMVAFYVMIVSFISLALMTRSGFRWFCFVQALSVWFYTGQPEIQILLGCHSVAENIANFATGGGEH